MGLKVQTMVTVRVRRAAALLMVAVASLVVSLGGCSQEQQDWRAAERRDSTQSYGQFIERHPDSELVKQARTRIAQLAEDRDWNQAGQVDTSAAYEEFLARHPAGKWAQEARIRMQNFALGVARPPGVVTPAAVSAVATPGATAGATPGATPGVGPATTPGAGAATSGTGVSARDDTLHLARTPAPEATAAPGEAATRPAAASAAATVATAPAATTSASTVPQTPTTTALAAGGYGIQLGAFSSEERANAEWHALEGRYDAQLHGLSPQVVAADSTSGRVFRLQAQAGDEARARMICEELRKLSQQCVPVVPH